MEEENAAQPQDTEACISCKAAPPLEGYPTALCGNCRTSYIKYPIPKWIYAFGAGVLVIMLFSMARLPRYLGVATDFGRAEKAIDDHNYLTAQRAAKKVLSQLPDVKMAKAYLLIAACYNKDMSTAWNTYASIKQETFESDMVAKIDEAVVFLVGLLPQDSTFTIKLTAAEKDSVPGLQRLFSELDTSYADDRYALQYLVVDKIYDQHDYALCRTLLQKMLAKDPENYLALSLIAAADRRLGYYDEGLLYCDKMLAINAEDVGALNQKTRIELTRNHDKEAAQYANRAYSIDPNDIAALEAKALVAHFAGKSTECASLLELIRKNETDSLQLVYNRVKNVVNGTEKFR